MKANAIRLGLALTACATLVAACSSSDSGSGSGSGQEPPKMEPLASVGNGEGELNLIAWAGYAENGSNDPAVDWVTPFEKETGCKVNVKIGNTSDEMVQLMRTGQYDGVSASGDAVAPHDLRRRRRAREHLAGAQLRDHLALPEGQAVELRQRPDVRHPARLGRQPLDVQHRRRARRPGLLGRGVRPTRASTRAR